MGWISDAWSSVKGTFNDFNKKITGIFDPNKQADGLKDAGMTSASIAGGMFTGGGGSSLLGPLISAGSTFLGNERTNSANSALSQRQMDFQERMRGTQYQAAMADMRQAGLNPILAYRQGGAGTPSGSSATMTNSAAAGMDAFNRTTNTSLAMKTTAKQLELLSAQARKETNLGTLANAQVAEKTKTNMLLDMEKKVREANLGYEINAAKTRSNAEKLTAFRQYMELMGFGGNSAKQFITVPLRRFTK